MFYKVRYVTPIDNLKLIVEFINGVTKIYDIRILFARFPAFEVLKNNKDLFLSVTTDTGGYGIIWNDYLDIACNELWENGKLFKTSFDGLLSFADASKIWGLSESTLRKAVAYGKIVSGIDASKFGHQWIVSAQAMYREYGEPKDN